MTASTETPEQRAREIADKHTRGRQPAQALLLLDIEAAIRAAVAAEREACWLIASEYCARMRAARADHAKHGRPTNVADCKADAGAVIAAAIRSRRP